MYLKLAPTNENGGHSRVSLDLNDWNPAVPGMTEGISTEHVL
jgi:hypothetical protein